MAFLTKEECVRRHRLLWNYVADQILEQEEVPWDYKKEAFEHFGWSLSVGHIFSYCWACYYHSMKFLEMVDSPKYVRNFEVNNCPYCLFDWTSNKINYCGNLYTLYNQFLDSKLSDDWKKTARIAREIANMPVREDV